jgi:hypothetical protein
MIGIGDSSSMIKVVYCKYSSTDDKERNVVTKTMRGQ